MPDNQLARLKVKQGHRIYLGSLIPSGELLDSMLSLPNAINPKLLDHNDAANSGEISFFLIGSQLIGQGWQFWDGHAW